MATDFASALGKLDPGAGLYLDDVPNPMIQGATSYPTKPFSRPPCVRRALQVDTRAKQNAKLGELGCPSAVTFLPPRSHAVPKLQIPGGPRMSRGTSVLAQTQVVVSNSRSHILRTQHFGHRVRHISLVSERLFADTGTNTIA